MTRPQRIVQLDAPQVGIGDFPDKRETISALRRRGVVGILAGYRYQLQLAAGDRQLRQAPPPLLIQREYERLTIGGPCEAPDPLPLGVNRPRRANVLEDLTTWMKGCTAPIGAEPTFRRSFLTAT